MWKTGREIRKFVTSPVFIVSVLFTGIIVIGIKVSNDDRPNPPIPSSPMTACVGCPEMTPYYFSAHAKTPSDGKIVSINIDPSQTRTIRVYYATDRRSRESIELFGDELNMSAPFLSYGYCHITIPEKHVRGDFKIESRKVFNQNSADPGKYFYILNHFKYSESLFRSLLSNNIKQKEDKSVLIYIHGFNNSFAEAVLRTGQLVYDIDYSGTPLLFSWPSNGGGISTYSQDEDKAPVAAEHLKLFIEKIVTQINASKISVVAHSMGNRVLTEAIIDLSDKHKNIVFEEVILAAPDVFLARFQQIADRLSSRANRFVIYSTERDEALLGSSILHKDHRLGFLSPPFPEFSRFQIIDASDVKIGVFGMHSGYAECRMMLDDIKSIVNFSSSNEKRPIIYDKSSKCWRIKRGT